MFTDKDNTEFQPPRQPGQTPTKVLVNGSNGEATTPEDRLLKSTPTLPEMTQMEAG